MKWALEVLDPENSWLTRASVIASNKDEAIQALSKHDDWNVRSITSGKRKGITYRIVPFDSKRKTVDEVD